MRSSTMPAHQEVLASSKSNLSQGGTPITAERCVTKPLEDRIARAAPEGLRARKWGRFDKMQGNGRETLLRSSQEAFTARCTLMTVTLMGIGLIMCGVASLFFSMKVKECRIPYNTRSPDDGDEMFRQGRFVLHVIDPLTDCSSGDWNNVDDPLYLYYELENFNQNDRKFHSSLSSGQFEGEEEDDWPKLRDACAPRQKVKDIFPDCKVVGSELQLGNPVYRLPQPRVNYSPLNLPQRCDQPIYPCGLLPTSVFTDRYRLWRLASRESSAGATDPSSSANPSSDDSLRWFSWNVYRRFNNTEPSSTAYSIERKSWYQDGEVNETFIAVSQEIMKSSLLEIADTREYISWGADASAADAIVSDLVENPTSSSAESDVRTSFVSKQDVWFWLDRRLFPQQMSTGHLLNWIRVASLPHFRKLYGKITSERVSLPLLLQIENNWDEKLTNTKKYIVLATQSRLGGNHTLIGATMLVLGFLSLILAIALFLCHKQAMKNGRGENLVLAWGYSSGMEMTS